MNEELNPIDERALDVFLSEIHGTSGPRDFSREIFSQLGSTPGERIDPAVTTVPANSRKNRSMHWIWTPIVISIAASVLIAVLYGRSNQPQPDVAPKIAATSETSPAVAVQTPIGDTKVEKELIVKESISESTEESIASDSRGRIESDRILDELPAHGFEPERVAVASAPATDNPSEKLLSPRADKPILASEPVRLVSKRLDNQLRTFWRELGVKPTAEDSSESISRRIAIALGVRVSKDALRDVEQLQKQLSQPTEARLISTRWMNEISMDSFSRLDEVEQEKLTSVLSTAIRERKGFDQVLADLISGRNPMASQWYTALGLRGADTMPIRLASVAMNQDLRCTRCHDSLMEGMVTQQDHWSFVAVVRSRVRANEFGQFEVQRKKTTANQDFFYDLPDGRRRLVHPAVASKWMGTDTKEPASELDQWSEDLVGSRALADGLVNSLWRTLYGRSLVQSNVDSDSSMDRQSLVKIQKEFSDDLIASGFDVARTLALMINSPSFRRRVPDVFEPKRSLLAGRDQLEVANRTVDAYAGTAPPRSKLSLSRRVAHVMRASGATIGFPDAMPATLLGQADESLLNPARKVPRNGIIPSEIPADFPSDSAEISLPWLDRISDFDTKVDHLSYLAGRGRTPPPVSVAVDAMKEGGTDNELILQRVLWLVSH